VIKTKIVCTLGPASSDEKTMEAMLRAGMNVARLNFSHGTHALHADMLNRFRAVRDRLGVPAAVLLDTRGPEIRLGRFAGGHAELAEGAPFTLTAEQIEGNDTIVSITYPDLPSQLRPGDRVLIDDGRLALRVENTTETEIHTIVTAGGPVSDRKGVNIPHVHLDMPYLSAQDEADLQFAVEHDVDFVAASFVRTAEDVSTVRNYLDFYGGHRIGVIAKIENEEGVANFDEILDLSDGIMIARGDMGVEIEFERLPGLQKKFIRKCYRAGKMVITATQMLESMIEHTTPTRAEITDVANAVFDGTSAIMLSGETAAGKNPALVVATMSRIARQAETDAQELGVPEPMRCESAAEDTTSAICDAACTTARDIRAAAIIAVTKSGYTARQVSKFRPSQPIIASTPDVKTFHQLALSWGVRPVRALFQENEEKIYRHAVDCAKLSGGVKTGDRVVITAGGRDNARSNALRIAEVGER